MSARRGHNDATDRWHLSFPGSFPLRIAIGALAGDEARAVASSWCARLREAGRSDRSAYAIQVTGTSRRYPRPLSRALGVRYLRGEAEDRLVHVGATVAITPGRPSALVLRRVGRGGGLGHVLEALDTALMHGAALQGVAFMHAGAFRIVSAGILAMGLTGSGKSTLAVASLHQGSRIVSDDVVLLGRDASGRLLVRTARRDAYLRRASCRVVPAPLRPKLQREGGSSGKWILRRDACPGRFALACTPKVAMRVRLDRRRKQPMVRRLSTAEVLAELINASSPLMVSAPYAAERAALMPVLVAFAETVPGFEVRMGTDLLTRPEATVKRLLADIGVGP